MSTARQHAVFLVVAIVFGVVGVGAGTAYLANGEIVIRAGESRRPSVANDGVVVGRIRPDDLLFYPLTIGWILVGGTSAVAATLALLTGSHVFGRTAAISCAFILVMGFVTVGAAYLYGDDPPAAKAPAGARSPSDVAGD